MGRSRISTSYAEQADGVVLDIGVSSMQLDEAERGFSFRSDGPLDMRMAQAGMSAADVVNRFKSGDLARIFGFLGEERHAGRIARMIEKRRETPAVRAHARACRRHRDPYRPQPEGQDPSGDAGVPGAAHLRQ